MPFIQPPPAPPKKITIGVRFEEQKLAALRRYGVFLGTRNLSHIISESLERVYKMDTEYKAWLKVHPDIAIEKKPRRNGAEQQQQRVALSGATAPSLVAAADVERLRGRCAPLASVPYAQNAASQRQREGPGFAGP